MFPIKTSLSSSLKFIHKYLQTLFSCSQSRTTPYHRIPKSHHPNNNKTQISSHHQHPAQTCNMNPGDKMKNRSLIEKGREERGERLVVAAKLKELVMMDRSNVDLVLDIEEVLHYYSRLRCPVYLDLFHKFFMELCSASEFGAACSRPTSGPNKVVVDRSRPKCRKIGR